MVIGITGKSGAGKSTICRYINNKIDNLLYISVDNIVEENLKGNIIEKVNNELKEKYNMGPYPRVEIHDSFYNEDPEHVLIYSIFKRILVEDLKKRIEYYQSFGKDILVDWFMLEVTDAFDFCDKRILLKASMDLRKDRVIKRGNYKAGFFERNEKSHDPEKEKLYDYIIDTTTDWKSKIDEIMNTTNIIEEDNSNSKPLISVIVPVYNGENYIKRCIESISHQTYRNLEIIIVNDGSTDSTLEICEKLKYDDYRIKIISQNNQGVSMARNIGIENATGNYIAFVDSDDYLEPDMYEIMQKNIFQSQADIARVRAFVYDREDNIRHIYNDNSIIHFDNMEDIIHNFVNGELSIAVWDKLFTREVIGNVRFKKEAFHEDTIFVWEVLKNAKRIVYNKKQVYHYKKREKDSLTSKIFDLKNFSLQEYSKNICFEIKNTYPNNYLDAELFYFNCLFFILKVYMRDFDKVKDNELYRTKIINLFEELDKLRETIIENRLITQEKLNNFDNIIQKIKKYQIESK